MGRRLRWIVIAAAATVALVVTAAAAVFWYRQTTGGLATTPARPPSPARFIGTRVIAVVAVDADGHPANGYRLAPASRDPGDIADVAGCDTSRAAIADNIYSCAPTAAGADVCWPSGQRSLLCLDDPWAKTLRRVAVQTGQLPNVHPSATPAPFALLLDDGTQCRLRNGGAWGGRDDGLVGAYGCPNESPAVLVAVTSNPGASAIDRSQALWTVKMGPLGAGDAHFPPPQTRTVATAWFAGDA